MIFFGKLCISVNMHSLTVFIGLNNTNERITLKICFLGTFLRKCYGLDFYQKNAKRMMFKMFDIKFAQKNVPSYFDFNDGIFIAKSIIMTVVI